MGGKQTFAAVCAEVYIADKGWVPCACAHGGFRALCGPSPWSALEWHSSIGYNLGSAGRSVHSSNGIIDRHKVPTDS